MLRLLFAGPLALLAAAPGAAFGWFLFTSPRSLVTLPARLAAYRADLRRGNGWWFSLAEPHSLAAALPRTIGRTLGAFGAARLVLLVFGLGAMTFVGLTVALLLMAWDLYWSWLFLRTKQAEPMLRLQRARLNLGIVMSLLGAAVFIRT